MATVDRSDCVRTERVGEFGSLGSLRRRMYENPGQLCDVEAPLLNMAIQFCFVAGNAIDGRGASEHSNGVVFPDTRSDSNVRNTVENMVRMEPGSIPRFQVPTPRVPRFQVCSVPFGRLVRLFASFR